MKDLPTGSTDMPQIEGSGGTDETIPRIPKVFVCILNWNGIQDTLICLKSALSQDYPDFRVVVVDNGSTDGSTQILRKFESSIDLIENKENLGFTGGCNAAIRHALSKSGDYVWLLNNDCECEHGTLTRLVAYAEEHPETGMVSPIITNRRNGEDSFAARRLDLTTGLDYPTANAEEAEKLQAQWPTQIMILGTALLVKRTLIEKIGLLDDRFFAYGEDTDFCVRSSQAGFRAACVTTARVYHADGLPDGGWRRPHGYYYAVRNGIHFWRKHVKGLTAWKFALWHTCMMFRILARAGYGRAETEAFADGLWSGLRGVTGRWEPNKPQHQMPPVLRKLFCLRPALTLGVIEANPKAVLRAFRRSR
jgi:GT2 family glycosyltransferase